MQAMREPHSPGCWLHASVAMIGAAAKPHFYAALASRDIIGQAKRVLMQQRNLTGLHA